MAYQTHKLPPLLRETTLDKTAYFIMAVLLVYMEILDLDLIDTPPRLFPYYLYHTIACFR